MNRDVVAERFQRLARESLIRAFDLLQAEDVGLPLLEPRLQVVRALAD
jgi:hypothetical protein